MLPTEKVEKGCELCELEDKHARTCARATLACGHAFHTRGDTCVDLKD